MVASHAVTNLCDATNNINFVIRKSKSCHNLLLESSLNDFLKEKSNENLICPLGNKNVTKKCQFFQEKFKFLGNKLIVDGCSKDPEKTKINALGSPNLKESQEILGFLNFSSKFIIKNDAYESSIYLQLKEIIPFIWSSKREKLLRGVITKSVTKSKHRIVLCIGEIVKPADSNHNSALYKRKWNRKNKYFRIEDSILSQIMDKIQTSEYASKYTILDGILVKKPGKLQKIIRPGQLRKELTSKPGTGRGRLQRAEFDEDLLKF